MIFDHLSVEPPPCETDYEERERQAAQAGCWCMMTYVLALVLTVVLCVMCSSCTTTKYVTVPEYHTDTVRETRVQKDSVFLKDSIFVNQYTKGDTVFRERNRWLTKYVLQEKHDTIYRSRTDSVRVPYPVEKKVPAQLTWWQQTRIHIGTIVIIILFIYFGFRVLKRYIKP